MNKADADPLSMVIRALGQLGETPDSHPRYLGFSWCQRIGGAVVSVQMMTVFLCLLFAASPCPLVKVYLEVDVFLVE